MTTRQNGVNTWEGWKVSELKNPFQLQAHRCQEGERRDGKMKF